ncbi:MAG: HEAT repeat domain-containing protein [Vicinamibacterales bacterium]
MPNVIRLIVLFTSVLSAASAAGQPRIENGRITSQPAGSSLAQTIRTLTAAQTDVAWIGYSVPVVDGERQMCCFDSGTTWINGTMVRSDGSTCCGVCRLEPSTSTSMTTRGSQTPGGVVKLEGSGQMTVLLRVSDKRVERVRVFSEDCPLDAGGRPVIWLENVRPADSVAYLEGLVTAQGDRTERNRITDGAVTAIALHGDAAADAALERLLAPGHPEHVRRSVPFWLGNTRGRRGLDVLRRVVKEDASSEVRKKAVFGISQSREPSATDTLIDAARTNDRTNVRGEAIFWLAQKAGQKAAAAITERIEQDPDTEVKKRAVFALSQLPKDEGVPLLIKVARTHTNPAVKKQAMFWLGQSKDPRALEFFAEILK